MRLGDRDDVAVPRLTRPRSLPADVRDVREVLGNAARLEMIHYLDRVGQASVAELSQHVGATRASIQGHLATMEHHGVVSADLPEHLRKGATVYWSVEPERVWEMLQTLGAHVLATSWKSRCQLDRASEER